MSIQQDINSALGQVGVLAALNPTLQARAKEGEELRKIKRDEKKLDKQLKAVQGDYNKAFLKQMMEEEAEVNKANGKPKELLAPKKNEENLRNVTDIAQNLVEKRVQLAKEKFDINPSRETYSKYAALKGDLKDWNDIVVTNVGKPITKEGKKAQEAIERAKRIQDNKNASRARRTKLLYGEMERMMPGFKYMEPKKQNKIIKDLGTDERKRIKDEAERREKYYGK